MATALVPLVEGFEMAEAIVTIDILRRAGIEVTIAGIADKRVKSSHGVVVETDALYADTIGKDYDALVLAGGPGTPKLLEVAGLADRLRAQHARGALVAAICAAPSVLAAAGLLKGKRAASFPSIEDKLRTGGATVCHEPVIEDGNVITSRGVGTALEFALALAARLAGEERAAEVAKAIVYLRG